MIGSFSGFFKEFSFAHLVIIALAFAVGLWFGWWLWGKLARRALELEPQVERLKRDLAAQPTTTPAPAPVVVAAPTSGGAEVEALQQQVAQLQAKADEAAARAEAVERNRQAADDARKSAVDGQKSAELAAAEARASGERQLAETKRFEAEVQSLRAQLASAQNATPATPAPQAAPTVSTGPSDAEKAAEKRARDAMQRAMDADKKLADANQRAADAEAKARTAELEKAGATTRVSALELELADLKAAQQKKKDETPTVEIPKAAPQPEPVAAAPAAPEPVPAEPSAPEPMAPASPPPAGVSAEFWAMFGDKVPVAAADQKDDLAKEITGIGPAIMKKLNGLGIYTLAQIAAFDADIVTRLTKALDAIPGKIERDDWVGQAKALLAGGPKKAAPAKKK